jgi:hypothetical protein
VKPTVGRIVHYVSHGTPVREDGTQAFPSVCRAAIITEVNGPITTVGLAVLNPTGLFFHESCLQYEGDHAGGTWHWPEFEASERREAMTDSLKMFNDVAKEMSLSISLDGETTKVDDGDLDLLAEVVAEAYDEVIQQISDGITDIDTARKELNAQPWGVGGGDSGLEGSPA